MSEETRFVVGVEDIGKVSDFLKKRMKEYSIFAFYGPLGAGKTFLVRYLLKACGVSDTITSPTFTYLNVYKNDQGETFYHFDLYRVETLQNFLAAGFEEYLYDESSWCFIEWPKIIEPLLQSKVCRIRIDYHEDADKRIFTID